MPASTHSAARDDVLVIEAPTAEQALEKVASTVGPHAQILGAEKVLRGGVGGFFARELVQVRVRPATPGDPAEADTQRPVPGLDAVLARLSSEHASEELDFAEALRREMASGGVAVAPAVPAPAAHRERPPRVAWSQRNLTRLELPAVVADAVAGLDPRDDAAWLHAVAGAVAPLCRALPDGPAVVVGPRAAQLGGALGLPIVRCGEQPPSAGAFCAVLSDARVDRSWLAAARRGRWLHLVAGGERWQGLLFDDPAAISWVGDESAPRAVRLAAELGLPLGYGVDGAGSAVPAGPVDVAVLIRSLLATAAAPGPVAGSGR